MSEVNLKRAFGFAVTVLIEEHWFTFFLSSIPATERFWAEASEEEKAKVKKAILYAFSFSMVSAFFVAVAIRDWIPVLTALILGLIVMELYQEALEGKF